MVWKTLIFQILLYSTALMKGKSDGRRSLLHFPAVLVRVEHFSTRNLPVRESKMRIISVRGALSVYGVWKVKA